MMVLRPSDAAYTAAANPEGPAPTIATSNTSSVSKMLVIPSSRASSELLGLHSMRWSGKKTTGIALRTRLIPASNSSAVGLLSASTKRLGYPFRTRNCCVLVASASWPYPITITPPCELWTSPTRLPIQTSTRRSAISNSARIICLRPSVPTRRIRLLLTARQLRSTSRPLSKSNSPENCPRVRVLIAWNAPLRPCSYNSIIPFANPVRKAARQVQLVPPRHRRGFDPSCRP